jgi:hypothetical protein
MILEEGAIALREYGKIRNPDGAPTKNCLKPGGFLIERRGGGRRSGLLRV